MTKAWQFLGTVAFWLAWPLLWLYLRWSMRTRVLVICDSNVLVVRSWLGDGKWSLPGGGLHRGEDPRDGVTRELFEETGLSVSLADLQLLNKDTITEHGLRYSYTSYWIKLPEMTPPRPSRFEITNAAWVLIKELTAKSASKDTITILDQWSAKR